jgi:hypothetical protein
MCNSYPIVYEGGRHVFCPHYEDGVKGRLFFFFALLESLASDDIRITVAGGGSLWIAVNW